MAEAIYLLCGVTSVTCAVLLLRGYRRSRTELLYWSALCFVALSLNNILLFVDLIVVPDLSLSVIRSGIALVGMGLLLFGLVSESH